MKNGCELIPLPLAAVLLGRDEATLRRWAREGKLPGLVRRAVNKRRNRLVPLASIEVLLGAPVTAKQLGTARALYRARREHEPYIPPASEVVEVQ
jgi:hypothetical protein